MNATVTIADQRFSLEFPTADAETTEEIVRIWDGWGRVERLNVSSSEQGCRLTVTILDRGSGVVELPDVRPTALWRSLYLVEKLRERIPIGVIADRFHFDSYEGSLSVDSAGPRPRGTFTLEGRESKWRIQFEGSSTWTSGGITRYPVEVLPIELHVCRVAIRDTDDPTDYATFNVIDAGAARMEEALFEHRAFRVKLAGGGPTSVVAADPKQNPDAQARQSSSVPNKKRTEYRVVNYDGSFDAVPESGLSGTVEVKPDGTWHLNLGFRKHVSGDFENFPFDVASKSRDSCLVVVRNVDDEHYAVRFEIVDASAEVLLADLDGRGVGLAGMMAIGAEKRRLRAAGEWWVGIKPERLLVGCHYSGARKAGEVGDLKITNEGISYKALLGSKVSIPWRAVQDIEVTRQSSKRVTAGRAVALGVFALAAKKGETYTYVHITGANSIWSFATKSSQGSVLTAMKPLLEPFNRRQAPRPSTPTISQPVSVADELTKLAALRDAGALTQSEFDLQKSRLLS